ncbi:hypothetical protein [Streptomyces sp. NPDC003996]
MNAAPFSSPEARLTQLLQANDVSTGAEVTNTAPEDVDPGPQGGIMRCLASVTTFHPGDSNLPKTNMACGWVNGNVAGLLITQMSLDGPEPEASAELTRTLRAQAESGGQ